MRSGQFPATLKASRITALFKGGNPTVCSNYRPVSIVSAVSKMYERVICSRLEEFLSSTEALHQRQFGFQKCCNTTSAVLGLVGEVVKSIEARRYTATIFLDVSKAFDCVKHDLRLEKLEKLWVRRPILDVLRDYLFGRTQRVDMGGYRSRDYVVNDGVPQGSVISPLLFRIFIDDIFELDLRGVLQLFADDGEVTYSADTLDELHGIMQHNLHLLEL